MAWRLQSAALMKMKIACSAVMVVWAVGCGSSGSSNQGGDAGDAGGSAGTGGTGATGTGGSSGATGGSGGTAGGGGGAAGSSGSGGTAGSAGTSGGGGSAGCEIDVPPSTQPFACGAGTCNPDQFCISPCCGGAGPQCLPVPDSGMCPSGNPPEFCPQSGEMGCVEFCTPPAPFCVDRDRICVEAASCRGLAPITERSLSCQCA